MNILKNFIRKRAGVYISRPVLNGDAWFKWATKFGVPSPQAAADMHVTILASRVDVKCKASINPVVIFAASGSFAAFGPEENVLAFTFYDFMLSDRFYFLCAQGGVSDWPEFRPHVTLSTDAKGFELSDEAIAAMPPSFVLGAERFADFSPAEAAEVDPDGDDNDYAPESILLVAYAGAAQQLEHAAITKGAGGATVDAYDLQTLDAITHKARVHQSAFDRLMEGTEVKKALSAPTAASIIEAAKTGAEEGVVIWKAEEERIAYGWASVSTVNDEVNVHHSLEAITIEAIKELCHGLIRGQRAGDMDHEGPVMAEIVEAIVFDGPLQKALGIDLGREGLFIGMHVPDPADWEVAKTYAMFSIAAKVRMVEVEAP